MSKSVCSTQKQCVENQASIRILACYVTLLYNLRKESKISRRDMGMGCEGDGGQINSLT